METSMLLLIKTISGTMYKGKKKERKKEGRERKEKARREKENMRKKEKQY